MGGPYSSFSKLVAASAFDGDPNLETHVCFHVMQAMARLFVFRLAQVHPSSELNKTSALPAGDVSIVCMDGFDCIRKVCCDQTQTSSFPENRCKASSRPRAHEESDEHKRFVALCSSLKLPLNTGKSLMGLDVRAHPRRYSGRQAKKGSVHTARRRPTGLQPRAWHF